MKNLLVVSLLIACSFALLAQSYEPMLNRPDITSLTGGTATDLDGIPTAGLAEGTIVIVNVASEARLYRLEISGDAESSPTIIRADDYGVTGKLWRTAITADPEETGYTPTGDDLGDHIATQNIETDGHWLSNDGGDEGVFVDSDGNVGIGTNAPAGPLDVYSLASSDAVDQSQYDNTGSTWNTAADHVGQSFTVGTTGLLTRVRLQIVSSAGNPAEFRIYQGGVSGTTGNPVGPLIYTQPGIVMAAGWNEVILSTPLAVNSGEVYTFQFYTGSQFSHKASPADVYAGGQWLMAWDGCDMVFDTYVQGLSTGLILDASSNVGIGTDSPTSKLQVVGLPVYANNAAAIAGGLTEGAFYRTGGDPDVVCVVHPPAAP